MSKWAKFLLILIRPRRELRRIATALETIAELYQLDCASRDIIKYRKPNKSDEVDVQYGVKQRLDPADPMYDQYYDENDSEQAESAVEMPVFSHPGPISPTDSADLPPSTISQSLNSFWKS